ncbi:citramalate synthase [Clostridium cellulovorans]|uniref:Citramalate synthase n=1 Tax=Clostridium cellulovorans (strain ATCC 35296 / DSM 3052 / OCM 3 / 743B) TaxID=573061 RepID=D9SVF0_CLOC7|nr:citramalate synthase [Clostridium cellulovorans]ADL51074.1 2-isopropylmalate synthase/homocitrate synthase family protein [Clostridium cellulovorans 743B]
MNKKITIFDSTLRDGVQGQGISFSVEDKLKIVKCLDKLGVEYIEAGNPGSNPKDIEFFKRIKELTLKKSKIVAFGSTRRVGVETKDDNNVKNLLAVETDAICIFGKSWDFHATEILKTTLDENLQMIKDTVSYLKGKNKQVFFDAEHFFDGYKNNSEYAMKTVEAAKEAGADAVVLCDTNGGTLPQEIYEITKAVQDAFKDISIGVHAHNDMGMAVANSIMAVEGGANHIQGTFIGFGERCGNANLSTIIPILQLKMGFNIVDSEKLSELTSSARFISEVSNITLNDDAPFVGNGAFAHKGGMHIDAVCKDPVSYEHIEPTLVGNKRRFLISEVSGKSTVYSQIQKISPELPKDCEETKIITERLKELEFQGYQFEGAEGTVELIMRKILGKYKPFFELIDFKVIGEQPSLDSNFKSTAMMHIVVDGKKEMTAAEGEGPINALDKALRKALEVFYPELQSVRLVDYKVRVLDTGCATKAKVRVLIESTDGEEKWSTVGVSTDIIEASWVALVDSIEYKLIKNIEKKLKAYF